VTPRVLEIDGLTKRYRHVRALEDVSLVARRGEIIGLLGPNGAGKTTMVSIICGLRRADSGSVLVNGVDALSHPERARKHIGLAPQDLGVYPIDTVAQNLTLFGELAGLRGGRLTREVETAAHALRLSGLLDRKAGELSGGQKRRLHTAIALLDRPPLILLDEATAGADVETRSALIDVVRRLAKEGSTVVYSTHYLHEIEALAARVVILDAGAVIADSSLRELVNGNGGGVVELSFDGAPPRLGGRWNLTTEGRLMRVAVSEPKAAIRDIFDALGPEAGRLQSVELIEPSLETVFMSLTGRRYESEEEGDVLAS
jgi:ABC-2 type transport system ATP-binding protein